LDDLSDYERERLDADSLEAELFAHEGRVLSIDVCVEELSALLSLALDTLEAAGADGQNYTQERLLTWRDVDKVRALFTALALHAETAEEGFAKQKVMYTLQKLKSQPSFPRSIELREQDLRHLVRDVKELVAVEDVMHPAGKTPMRLMDFKWDLRQDKWQQLREKNRMYEENQLRQLAKGTLQQLQGADSAEASGRQQDTNEKSVCSVSLVEHLLHMYDRIEDIVLEIFTYGHPDRAMQQEIFAAMRIQLEVITPSQYLADNWVYSVLLQPFIGQSTPPLLAYERHKHDADYFLFTRILSGSQPFTAEGVLLSEPEELSGYSERCYACSGGGSHQLKGCYLLWESGDSFHSHVKYMFGLDLPTQIATPQDMLHDLVDHIHNHTPIGEYCIMEHEIHGRVTQVLLEVVKDSREILVHYTVNNHRVVSSLVDYLLPLFQQEVVTLRVARFHPDILEYIHLYMLQQQTL
jgi:hypothetical protein